MYDQGDYIGLDQVLSAYYLWALFSPCVKVKTYELGEYIRLDQDVLKMSSRRMFAGFIVNFKNILHLPLVFLLSNLSKQLPLGVGN